MNKKKGLGKGLSALLSAMESEESGLQPEVQGTRLPAAPSAFVPLDAIDPNPGQPRTQFDDEALEELAASIRELGIIQPVTLRQKPDGRYEIISGERRYRAARMAGLSEIPAFIRSAGDSEMLEMALVENIQREDLNPLDVALSLKRLLDEFSLTQEQLARRIGKQRSTLANFVRLLKLPPEIQKGLREGLISMGHARALINVPDEEQQIKIFRKTVAESLSVRQVEDLVRKLARPEDENPSEEKVKHSVSQPFYPEYLEKLTDFFGTNVEIRRTAKGAYKVIITYDSEADMAAFMDRMPHA